MPTHLGSAAIDAAYLGASAVDKIYLGANAVYTALAPPAQVTGLGVDSTGDGTIDLSWTAPAAGNVTDYVVEYTPSGGSAATVNVGSATTSYQLTGLTNGTEYSVRVAASNAGLVGAYSTAVTGTPSAAAPPAQVTGLAVDATGDGTIDLSWTAPASDATITDYSVEYTPSGGSATTVLVGSAATTYQLTGLTNDTDYSVRVAAVSAAGTGAYSTAVTGTPSAGDPYFANVSLLLHMDGSGSSFVDSSPSPKSVTAVGSVTQSTAQHKFGGKSAYFAGTAANYLTLEDSDQFNLPGDFVIEAWVYFTAYSQSWAGAYGACLLANYKGGGGESASADAGFQLRINGSASDYSSINLYTGRTDLNWTGISLPLNTWTHIAVARSGSTIRAYVDGSKVGTDITNSDAFTESEFFDRKLFIGKLDEATYTFAFPGYIDDLRITKGTDRGYTGSTITVPTAAFPDS